MAAVTREATWPAPARLEVDTDAVLIDRSRSSAKNTTIDPLKAGNATGEVKKGSKVLAARLVTAIVDEAGQRR